MNKKCRFFISLLAVMLCMAAFLTVAYAAEGDNGFTPDGTGTVVNNATAEDGKEFYTITTPDKHVFYLIIDRQRGTENVYFLDAVTEKDLLALAKGTEDDEPVVSAPMTAPTAEPTNQPEADAQSQPEKNSAGGIIAAVLFVAVIAGGAVYFFKFRKPKKSTKGKSALDEYDFDEDQDEPDEAEDEEQKDDTETEEKES
jgi:hypothetical protein